ncbi:MAG: hypothetical protein FWC22_00130 [Treponema sp.]|nr:hypothetical protein [Treponema sp.]
MDDELNSEDRPNSNYKLSNTGQNPSSEEGLTFYYNRERRLENAPQSVKDLYKKETAKPRLGLLGPLIADKPRRAIFFVIIFLCILIFALSRLGFFDNTYSLDGNKIDVSGKIEGEDTFIILKKTIEKEGAYIGTIEIVVSIPVKNEQEAVSVEDQQVYSHKILFTSDKIQMFSFPVPFNVKELLMVIQSEKSTVKFSFKPE